MDAAQMLAKRREQRRFWVELPDGKRVQCRRPHEGEFGKFLHGVTIEHVCAYAVDWAGFTEADLLGAGIGASDAAPFDPELWDDVARDRTDYVSAVAKGLAQAIEAHLKSKAAIAGN